MRYVYFILFGVLVQMCVAQTKPTKIKVKKQECTAGLCGFPPGFIGRNVLQGCQAVTALNCDAIVQSFTIKFYHNNTVVVIKHETRAFTSESLNMLGSLINGSRFKLTNILVKPKKGGEEYYLPDATFKVK